MSDYHKRYNACFGFVSTYFNTAEELEKLIVHYGQDPDWITEGWGEETYDYPRDGVTMVTRRTTGKVRLTEIRYEAARAEVQRLLAS